MFSIFCRVEFQRLPEEMAWSVDQSWFFVSLSYAWELCSSAKPVEKTERPKMRARRDCSKAGACVRVRYRRTCLWSAKKDFVWIQILKMSKWKILFIPKLASHANIPRTLLLLQGQTLPSSSSLPTWVRNQCPSDPSPSGFPSTSPSPPLIRPDPNFFSACCFESEVNELQSLEWANTEVSSGCE